MARFIYVVDSYPETARLLKFFGDWSLKDLLAHFSGWNLLSTKQLNSFLNGRPVKDWPSKGIAAFNTEQVQSRINMSWNETYEEFISSKHNLVSAFGKLNTDEWKIKLAPDKSLTPEKSLMGQIKHYKHEHLPELETKLAELKRKNHDLQR